jgi:RNA polymerase sigma-70 factor, ECF subfamily
VLGEGIVSEATGSQEVTPDPFLAVRPLLLSISYRMLGSTSEAEDIVQEAYVRWHTAPREAVDSPRSYLSTVVTRLCIDRLRSAKEARETYAGPWLPEPILTVVQPGPEETIELAESLSIAFLVLLESLSPLERAVFLLRRVFEFGYAEIAEMVGRSEAACRQLVSRAARHLGEGASRSRADRARAGELASRFLAACASGDLASLLSLLTDDAVVIADGGGRARAARRPIVGKMKVATYVIGISKMATYITGIVPSTINGQPGFVFLVGARVDSVLALDISSEGVDGVHIVANPDKLKHIAGQIECAGQDDIRASDVREHSTRP